jgi:hypothetical protein
MDIHTAGLAHALSTRSAAIPAYRANEDAYYAAYDDWHVPAWLIALAAALHAPRHHWHAEPASIREPELA